MTKPKSHPCSWLAQHGKFLIVNAVITISFMTLFTVCKRWFGAIKFFSLKRLLRSQTADKDEEEMAAHAVANTVPTHLGDIIGIETAIPLHIVAELEPMERVVLTASGNLQLIISAFYNSPVRLHIHYNTKTGHGKYSRKVSLFCLDKEFCVATSSVTITDPNFIAAVETNSIGIGQLFAKYKMLPRFKLFDAARTSSEFWRVYELAAPGIVCVIREEFYNILLLANDSSPSTSSDVESAMLPVDSSAPSQSHFGDLMRGTETSLPLLDSKIFSSLDRVVLTANGNLQRIISSYYNSPVNIAIRSSKHLAHGKFLRDVTLSCFSRVFCVAESTITVTGDAIIKLVEAHRVDVTQVFRAFDLLPVFTLLEHGRGTDGALWRKYELRAAGVLCEVHEIFSASLWTLDTCSILGVLPEELIAGRNQSRVSELHTLPPPQCILDTLPTSSYSRHVVLQGRSVVRDVLNGIDDRLIVVVGPCSVADVESAMQYAYWLKDQTTQFEKDLVFVMRCYFEKPRTALGWKGFINDPDRCGVYNIPKGLRVARDLLLKITELGLPVACEFLDTVIPNYLVDCVTWAAIGARTVESPLHRELVSALGLPVGLKNNTDGNIQVAVNAMLAASQPHHFVTVTPNGLLATASSMGNEDTHIILRGGRGAGSGNYNAACVAETERLLTQAKLPKRIMIDCSHGNVLGNGYAFQKKVAESVAEQVSSGSSSIMGVMIESNLVEGSQSFSTGGLFVPGLSFTDGCIGLEMTTKVLKSLSQAVRERRAMIS